MSEGGVFPPGAVEPRRAGLSRQESYRLVAMGAALLVLFAVTSALARRLHHKEGALSAEWSERGRRALEEGRAEQAVEAFRSALVYSHHGRQEQFGLAQALLAAGRDDEARAYLLTLWEREPGSGIVNLELARLAARSAHEDAARRYYQGAIFGLWERQPVQQRRRARQEFVEFLLARGRAEEALAGAIGLSVEAPDTVEAHLTLGRLYLGAGSPRRALDRFRQALRQDPGDQGALEGAGAAAFQLGEFEAAHDLLGKAFGQQRSTELAAQYETATFVLAVDPDRPRLSSTERALRTMRAWAHALDRLRDCRRRPSAAGYEAALASAHARLRELKPTMRLPTLRRRPELRDEAVERAYAAERVAVEACPSETTLDRAFRVLAERSEPER